MNTNLTVANESTITPADVSFILSADPDLALAYDTETTGLIQYKLPSDDPSQPRITQIAADLFNVHTKETVASINFLIKPEGWVIPENVALMTGITTEKCEKYGFPIGDVLPAFMGMVNKASHRIAHNDPFDARMIRIEMMMCGIWDDLALEAWKSKESFCTQSNSTKIVNDARPAGDKKKTASMAEAYEYFTDKILTGAHNAKVDMEACKTVYFGILNHKRMAA